MKEEEGIRSKSKGKESRRIPSYVKKGSKGNVHRGGGRRAGGGGGGMRGGGGCNCSEWSIGVCRLCSVLWLTLFAFSK